MGLLRYCYNKFDWRQTWILYRLLTFNCDMCGSRVVLKYSHSLGKCMSYITVNICDILNSISELAANDITLLIFTRIIADVICITWIIRMCQCLLHCLYLKLAYLMKDLNNWHVIEHDVIDISVWTNYTTISSIYIIAQYICIFCRFSTLGALA